MTFLKRGPEPWLAAAVLLLAVGSTVFGGTARGVVVAGGFLLLFGACIRGLTLGSDASTVREPEWHFGVFRDMKRPR